MEDTLKYGLSEYSDLFNRAGIDELDRRHQKGEFNVGYHLWGLLILFLWMKVQGKVPASTARARQAAAPLVSIWLVAIIVGAIYLGCTISPPSLMDDVDAVQAQIAKTMLTGGDWVTARLDGVLYLEKSPLIYWLIAIFYKIFGVTTGLRGCPWPFLRLVLPC